jgi:hypothetical protein
MLHLAPNSTDAQVFEDFAASNKSNAVVAGNDLMSTFIISRECVLKWMAFLFSTPSFCTD